MDESDSALEAIEELIDEAMRCDDDSLVNAVLELAKQLTDGDEYLIKQAASKALDTL